MHSEEFKNKLSLLKTAYFHWRHSYKRIFLFEKALSCLKYLNGELLQLRLNHCIDSYVQIEGTHCQKTYD